MTGQTPHLGIAYLAAEQAQKHVTVNEALARLDALVHLTVKSRSIGTPPVSPQEGDRYIIASPATGAWAGHGNSIALWSGGDWMAITPRAGFQAWVEDEGNPCHYDGGAWTPQATDLQNVPLLGVGTSADAVNPFSAQVNNALWTALPTAEGGTGDLRYVLNKQASGNTLAMLFQSDYSGRAEIGLRGNEDFTLATSPDGSLWKVALVASAASGNVGIKNTPVSGVDLDIYGDGKVVANGASSPSFKQIRNGAADNYLEMTLVTQTEARFDLTNPSGPANMMFYCKPLDGTSSCLVGFFRTTNTSGSCYFNFYRGNNTSNTSSRIYGSSNATDHSFVNAYAGNFGIGTAGPVDKLAVAGNIVPQTDNAYSCGRSDRRFTQIWAVTGTIQTSDARLKTGIEDSGLGLGFINLLRPRSYKWISGSTTTSRVETIIGEEEWDTGERDGQGNPVMAMRPVTSETEQATGAEPGRRTHYGLIAQEVKAALGAVGCSDFAGYIKTDPGDPGSEEGLRYDQFIAPLIKAVQQLGARLDALESQ